MKYCNNLSDKFATILNNNRNNIKVGFITNTNLMNQINRKSRQFTNHNNNLNNYSNSGIYKMNCSCGI